MQLPAPEVGVDDAGRAARSVLSEQKYIDAARPPSLRERFFDWLWEAISDLLGALSTGGGRGLIAWLIVGVFVGLVVFLLFRLLGHVEPIRARQVSSEPDIDVRSVRTAKEWLEAAVVAESEGKWRLGLRCRHQALAVDLHRRDLVEGHPGITAAEIAVQASTHLPGARHEIGEATRLFEEVWYGFSEPGPQARDRFVALVESITRTADSGALAEAHP